MPGCKIYLKCDLPGCEIYLKCNLPGCDRNLSSPWGVLTLIHSYLGMEKSQQIYFLK